MLDFDFLRFLCQETLEYNSSFISKHKFSSFLSDILYEVESNVFDRSKKVSNVYEFLLILVFISSVTFKTASIIKEP